MKLQRKVQASAIDFELLSKEGMAPIRFTRLDDSTGKEVTYKDSVKSYQ